VRVAITSTERLRAGMPFARMLGVELLAAAASRS
jgi:hypothetical protein